MIKIVSWVRPKSFGAVCFAFALAALGQTAGAQDPSSPAVTPQNGGAGVRAGHITATGETVPNPGASQGAGTTAMDRGVEQDDTKIQSSICKGC